MCGIFLLLWDKVITKKKQRKWQKGKYKERKKANCYTVNRMMYICSMNFWLAILIGSVRDMCYTNWSACRRKHLYDTQTCLKRKMLIISVGISLWAGFSVLSQLVRCVWAFCCWAVLEARITLRVPTLRCTKQSGMVVLRLRQVV
jgi:hypothetical protein